MFVSICFRKAVRLSVTNDTQSKSVSYRRYSNEGLAPKHRFGGAAPFQSISLSDDNNHLMRAMEVAIALLAIIARCCV
jgi:hypothetical protein